MTSNSQIKRTVFVNEYNDDTFSSNRIKTTKYTVLTFLPLFLYNQFKNFTNIFFAVIIILQEIPGVSPFGVYITVIPLTFVFAVDAIQEIINDYQKILANKSVNTKEVLILKDKKWTRVQWQDLKVGNIVKVLVNTYFPADLLLVQSSNVDGIGYIETTNLDGETNLKLRRDLDQLRHIKNPEELSTIRAKIECDLPNDHIYVFSGTIQFDATEKIPLGVENFLLRESVLRNTKWVIGVVLYTGSETKVMRNANKTPMKRSSLICHVNKHIVTFFIILMLMSALNATLYYTKFSTLFEQSWYVSQCLEISDSTNYVLLFLTFVVLYSSLIPISLQVSQNVVKCVQTIFIDNDVDMYYKEEDIPCKARTCHLNEDLGKIKYIFTDKTGTLTQNKLLFKGCVINGAVFVDNTLNNLNKLSKTVSSSDVTHHFFMCIVLCHGVIPVEDPDTKEITYYTSSPDQHALVIAASKYGYVLKSRRYNSVIVSVHGVEFLYTVKAELEFTSERRRSSVVVVSPDNKTYLYVMGADDVIYKRLSSKNNDKKVLDSTLSAIESFAVTGLRTLCLGMVEIKPDFFPAWEQRYVQAATTLHDRGRRKDAVAELIENDIVLIGATAVEDKLQHGVPETLEKLLSAGMHVWMLTGDKQETAVNIGFSTRLIEPGMGIVVLNSNDVNVLRKTVQEHIRKLKEVPHDLEYYYVCLVVTGDALKALLESEYKNDFISLAVNCKSVIVCRAGPLRKSQIVDCVRKFSGYCTVAVGDGANDVAMIQKATVGIGISGGEGQQAAQASDFSFGQFRYLVKLLLVHGTWDYNRVCNIILYMYYKNVAFTTMLFLLSLNSGGSAFLTIDRASSMVYNILYTSGAIAALGLFDKVASKETLQNQPAMYRMNNWMDLKVFVGAILHGIWHGLLVVWLCFSALGSSCFWSNGRSANYTVIATTVYLCLIMSVCIDVAIRITYWNYASVLTISSAVIFYFLVVFVLSYAYVLYPLSPDYNNNIWITFSSPLILLTVLIVPVAVNLPDFIILVLWGTFVAINKLKLLETGTTFKNKKYSSRSKRSRVSHEVLYSEGECTEFCHGRQHAPGCGRKVYRGFAYTYPEPLR